MTRSVEEKVEEYYKKKLDDYGIRHFGKTESINDDISKALHKAASKSGGKGNNYPDIQLLLDSYTNNLDDLEKRIKAQIKEIKLRSSHYKKAYVNGYINGCEYVQKAIHRSKRFMMDKILNEVL